MDLCTHVGSVDFEIAAVITLFFLSLRWMRSRHQERERSGEERIREDGAAYLSDSLTVSTGSCSHLEGPKAHRLEGLNQVGPWAECTGKNVFCRVYGLFFIEEIVYTVYGFIFFEEIVYMVLWM